MQLQEMAKNKTVWLSGEGPESEVVLSSRIRLARNISGKPFPARANRSIQQEILNLVEETVKKTSMSEATFLNLSAPGGLDKIDRQFLMERHLISYEHAQANFVRGVMIGPGEKISMMINEEDHLRLQSLEPGFALNNAWDNLNSLDDELAKFLPFAFSQQWGFLTACPTNTGTGLRTSCLMHLPALVHSEEIEHVLQNLSKIGIVARGFYGEGTKVLGDFFQISNATTLGQTENEIVDNLSRVGKQIIDYEKKSRTKLLTESITKTKTEDTIYRAYGLLANARTITYEETINHLSKIRLGIYLGLNLPVDINILNELLLLAQPAHLQEIANKELSSTQRDVLRAEFIRQKLNKTTKNKIDQKKINKNTT
jgi:protein arginine kinase